MDRVLDTLEWARRAPRRLRRMVVRGGAIAVAVVAAFAISVPVLAHDAANPSPPACATTPPITLPCTPTVNPPASAGAPYTITLPGIGTLNVSVDPATGKVTAATVSGLGANITASNVKIDSDNDKVSVTFTNTASGQVYRVTVRTKPPATAGASPTVTARASDRHHCDGHGGSGFGDHDGDGRR